MLAQVFEGVRPELIGYLCRLVVRPVVAEDLAQSTYLRCHEAADRLPDHAEGQRAWIFRVATNLALDELRRHRTWRETTLADIRSTVEADPEFVSASQVLASTPETRAIAREHLVTCFACTLRNLPERRAAALLLKEVHGFAIEETAGILDATPAQVKNWLHEARAEMDRRYGATCALVSKAGVCHQCVELDAFFAAGQGAPLEPGRVGLDDRLAIAREWRAKPPGHWHRMMLAVVDDLG